ncbi:thiol:disulfide interchange protein DsbA/DsbL [Ferrimonas pelagia]|uniref:Thiol:disulfide interchange protein n=1 Tax=Ferrimonas pelagia TaxID=1177826 RepID=A0ABP9EU32_9GAMM
MKKTLTALFTLAVAFSAQASTFKEGEHYQVLKPELQFNAPKEVSKIYSVNCPFCYKYETAVVPNMVKNLPEGAGYDGYHITTKTPLGLEKSQVLAVAQVMGNKKGYKAAKMDYYKHFHDDKMRFADSAEAIAFGLKSAGISKADFDAKVNTPEVKQLLTKWDQGVEIAKIQGIPALVVNGKYLITTAKIRSMTMLDEMVAELMAAE